MKKTRTPAAGPTQAHRQRGPGDGALHGWATTLQDAGRAGRPGLAAGPAVRAAMDWVHAVGRGKPSLPPPSPPGVIGWGHRWKTKSQCSGKMRSFGEEVKWGISEAGWFGVGGDRGQARNDAKDIGSLRPTGYNSTPYITTPLSCPTAPYVN